MSSQLNIKKIAGLTSGVGSDTLTLETGGADRVTVTNTAITLAGATTISNTATIMGNIIPGSANTYTLGSNTASFQSAYFGTGIYLNGGTTSANQLDDYEEGTWTPRIRGGSSEPGTLITGNGVYTKIGNQVSVLMDFDNKNMTGYSGAVSIDSFPFAQASGFSAGGAAGMIYSLLGANASREHTGVYMGNGGTTLNFYDINAAGAWSASQHGAPAGMYLWTTFTYFTS